VADNKKWFDPQVETGWSKDMAMKLRRRKVLQSHDGDELAAAQSMQALANVTQDRETRIKAKQDAEHFYRCHNRKVKQMRLTARTPRITEPFRRLS
jgi:hypothetical protein